jgi:hypothetical protein
VRSTVAGDDDVAVLQADSGVLAGPEDEITAVTGEPPEPPRKFEPVALGDTAGALDVSPGAVVSSASHRLPSEDVQPLDAFLGNGHVWRVTATRPMSCAPRPCPGDVGGGTDSVSRLSPALRLQ